MLTVSSDGRVISGPDEGEPVHLATLIRAKGLKNIVLVGVPTYSCSQLSRHASIVSWILALTVNVNKGTRHAAFCAENWVKDSTSGRPDSSFTCTSLTLLSLSKSNVNGVAEAILKLRNRVRLFVRKVVGGVRVCTLCTTLTIDGSLLV